MHNILKKNFIIIAAAVLLITAYFIMGLLIYSNNRYNDINTGNLEEAVKIIAGFTPAEVFTDTDAAAAWASGFGSSGSYRITLINRSGQVLFDTQAGSLVMETHLDREEFQDAVRTGTGTARRHSATLGQHYIYAAVAITDAAGGFAGILRLSHLVPGFFYRLLSSALPFLITGFIIILGSCGGLYQLSRRLSLSVEEKLDAELKEKTAELKTKAEEAEAESLHREAILNGMFEGIITLDGSLKIIYANARLHSMFGISREENVCGMSLLEFCRWTELEEAAAQALSENQPREIILKRYVSGGRQHFQVYAAPLEAGNGVIVALKDISRLVKLEQVRKDFAANVSHELRTPIQVIQGFAENILACSPSDHEQIFHFAGIIKKNAQSMDNLANDLLTLVSLEDEGAARPPMERSALAPLIEEALNTAAVAARKKNITIDISCPPDLCINLHTSLFIHALFNLLDNSIKYSDDGSPVKINAFKEGEEAVIEVKDKGIGIPAEHIERIFERFYRVDRGRSREAGGTGLGLSIVRHIALLHRGRVEAESHAGEGSVFRLYLPAAKN